MTPSAAEEHSGLPQYQQHFEVRLSAAGMALATVKNDSGKLLTEKFLKLRSEALKRGLSDKQVREAIDRPEDTSNGHSKEWWRKCQTFLTNPAHRVHLIVLSIAFAVGLCVLSYELMFDYIASTPCIVDSNMFSEEFFRPKIDCNICKDIRSVPEESDLSPESFLEKYAFTGKPVLVKGATTNWTAMNVFSFKFFQKLYKETEGALPADDEDCQFFQYQTKFQTLADALNMSDDRANFKPGELPWYFGWCNCHKGVGRKLRKHYQRPYFLPPNSESVPEDWIFMGGPGVGAALHVDYVERPSWQAQISGTKTWTLVPSPECEHACHSFNITVQKGDIIVVDTNIWYHSTFVHPGEISISIGSEYD